MDGQQGLETLTDAFIAITIPDFKGETFEDEMCVNMFVETLYDLIVRYDEVVKEKDQSMKVRRPTFLPFTISYSSGVKWLKSSRLANGHVKYHKSLCSNSIYSKSLT
jgi:hypothetical protein